MRVMVIGATGLIGSSIAKYYLERDETVVVVSRKKEKLKEVFSDYSDYPKIEFLIQDVSIQFNLSKIELEKEPLDLIFYAAGSAEQDVIRNKPTEIIKANIFGSISMLEFMKDNSLYFRNTRIILYSSVSVYEQLCNQNESMQETDFLRATLSTDVMAPYFESKRMLEVIAIAYHKQHGMDVIAVRPSTVYGYAPLSQNSAFYSFINSVLKGKEIVIKSRNLPRRDNIYIKDFVRAMAIIAQQGIAGEIYNVSSNGELGNHLAIDEIAEKIKDVANRCFKMNVSVSYEEDENLCERRTGIKLNNSKLKQLSWNLEYSFEDAIKETLDLYLK